MNEDKITTAPEVVEAQRASQEALRVSTALALIGGAVCGFGEVLQAFPATLYPKVATLVGEKLAPILLGHGGDTFVSLFAAGIIGLFGWGITRKDLNSKPEMVTAVNRLAAPLGGFLMSGSMILNELAMKSSSSTGCSQWHNLCRGEITDVIAFTPGIIAGLFYLGRTIQYFRALDINSS